MATLPQVLSRFTGTSGSPTAATLNPTMSPEGGFTDLPGEATTTPQQLMAAVNANYAKNGLPASFTLQQAQAAIAQNPQAYNQPPAAPTAASLGYQAPPQSPTAPPISTQPVAPPTGTQSRVPGSSPGDGYGTASVSPGTTPNGGFLPGTVQGTGVQSGFSPTNPTGLPFNVSQQIPGAAPTAGVGTPGAPTATTGSPSTPPNPGTGGSYSPTNPTGLYSPGYGGTPPYPGTGTAPAPGVGATGSPFPYGSTAQATSALTPTSTFNPTPGQLPAPNFPSTSVPAFPGQSDQNLAPELEAQKQMVTTQGNQLLGQYQQTGAAAQNTSNQLQSQYLKSIAPLVAGQGGYTPEQQQAIMAQGGPFGMDTLDPNANIAAFQQGATGVNGALAGGQGAVNDALTQGSSAVNSAIDPAALRLSPQFQQNLESQAANAARVAAQAQQQGIQNSAFAAGNVSPLSIAAAENRAGQQGDLAAADALTNARVQGEQARLAAEQQATNIQAQNAQETAQRNTGAQLQQEATNVGAQQGIMGAGQAATQAQQAQGMDLNQLESGRAQTVANANVQAGQEGRAGLSGQQQQAQQTALTSGQQELGAFGTTAGATNQAGATQITNKATNAANSPINLLLGGAAKGGVFKGPIVAEVGEHPNPKSPSGYDPEAIVPIGPPRMASGGVAGLPSLTKRLGSIAPKPPAAVKLPRFADPHIGIPKGHYGISPSNVERTMTRNGYQRILPQFADGGVVHMDDGGAAGDPNADLTDQDSPGMWGPTNLQKALAVVGALAPRLGGIIGAIPGATWQDPSKAQVPEWARVLGAVSPKAGRAASAVTQAVGGPPKPPPDPGVAQQKALWQGEQPYIWRDPTLPKINDAILVGGGSNKKKLNLGSGPTAPPQRQTPPPPQTTTQPVPKGVGISWDPTTDPTHTIDYGNAPGGNPSKLPLPTSGPPPDMTPVRVPGGGYTPPNMGAGFYNPPGGDTGGIGGIPTNPGSGSQDPNYGINYGDAPVAGGDFGSLPIGTIPGPDPGQFGPNNPPPPSQGDLYSPGGSSGYGSGADPLMGSGDGGSNLPGKWQWGQSGGLSDPGAGGFVGDNPWPEVPGIAKGGVAIPRTRFGPTEIVDRPQMRVLGKNQPQAVIPLNKKKGNRVRPQDVPKLVDQYA